MGVKATEMGERETEMGVREREMGAWERKMGRQEWGQDERDRDRKYGRVENMRMGDGNMETCSPPLLSPYSTSSPPSPYSLPLSPYSPSWKGSGMLSNTEVKQEVT